MQFPIQHAAPSLKGKPPEELPHGLITPPPEVRQLVEEQRVKHSPEAFATGPRGELWMLNDWTIDYYFDGLNHKVIYRQTPEGPEVVAVGYDEVSAFEKAMPLEEQLTYEIYQGY
jgi:hypothetical protein